MDGVYEKALELHRLHHGKLEVASKVPLVSREDLSLSYTPGVAEVSSTIGRDASLARAYTLKANTIAVVSDGSAILGLGNLGPEAAIPVMEGKAVLFKKFANVDAFPLCLATQDVEDIIATVKRVAPVFGGINLEDIAAPRCFEIEKRLQAELSIPVMHDDQHGTAVVVLAGLINALRVIQKTKEMVRIVVNGAGAAGIAVVELLHTYGFSDISVVDSHGVLHANRDDLNPSKRALVAFTNKNNQTGTLADVLSGADVFIGVSKAGVLTSEMVEMMGERPILFALANPIPEIMPDVAARTKAFVVATGRSDFPNQINNVLAFPGIFRGALDNNVLQFTNAMFVAAAEAIAGLVQEPTRERILPDVFDERIVPAVARSIA